MLDINLLRRDLNSVVARLEARKTPQPFLDVARYSALEAERKTLQTGTEELQARRNALSKQIGQAKGKGDDASALMAQVAAIADDMKRGADRLEALQAELQTLLMGLPNLPDEGVPVGADEHGNVEVRRWGTPGTYNFTVKDHVDLGTPLGLDFETGAQLAGARFSFMRGPIARLHRALAAFMLDTHTQQHGYTECYTPYMVNAAAMRGTGQLPKFEQDLFHVTSGDGDASGSKWYLIPTSEVTLTNSVADRILSPEQLPIKLTGHTPCFRSEAGSAGRGHPRHDPPAPVRQGRDGADHHARPELCGARPDGRPCRGPSCRAWSCPTAWCCCAAATWASGATKTFDLEVWLPAQATYREISSCSNMGAFQARRMQARFKNAQGKTELVHTPERLGLGRGPRPGGGAGETTSRPDGSIRIPAALRPYLGGAEVLKP